MQYIGKIVDVPVTMPHQAHDRRRSSVQIIDVVVQIHPTQGRHQGNRLKCALTRSDGKERDDTATLEEEKGDVSFVVEELDVERVTVTHKNSDR